MYESPIDIIYGEVQKALEKEAKELDNAVMTAIRKIGININEEELVKALQYDREQYQKGYNDGLNANKWISVDDELPDKSEAYVVYSGIVLVAWYRPGTEQWEMPSGITTKVEDMVVTHWQPLPEPPEESEI